MRYENAVLGIDAAWTDGEPSGVALLVKIGGHWTCRATAPSYDSFRQLAEGQAVDWDQGSFDGTPADPAGILENCRAFVEGDLPSVIAVDMPLSRSPIIGRRAADDAISREFGARNCGTHSPSAQRPGKLSPLLERGFGLAGYQLHTQSAEPRPDRCLIEVYPHPALLRLLDLDERLPYKVSKSSSYWPTTSVHVRKARLLEGFQRIRQGLLQGIVGIPDFFHRPEALADHPFKFLKRFEDALDAMISAWVAVEHLEGRTTAYGDAMASIWVPGPQVLRN